MLCDCKRRGASSIVSILVDTRKKERKILWTYKLINALHSAMAINQLDS